MPDAIPHVIAITQGDIELAPLHQCNVALLGKSLAAARVLGLLAARGPALLIRHYS